MSVVATPGAKGNVPPEGLERRVQDGDLPADPWDLVRAWLPEDDDPDRPLCTLATVGLDGVPNARTVLLSAVHDGAVAIHTEASSRKAAELAAHPSAAIVVRWPELARQLVLRGPVAPTAAEEASAAFGRRSRYLQLLASLNEPEMAARPRAEREAAFAAFDAATPAPPEPDGWVGFALTASEILLWEGSERGPSRRARYARAGEGWELSFLPG
ncbi:pyridoxamine 5'-phosphate oxidase family protein [Microbacterium indicum]|uniref:pyridoxamine 5'-phosphate oxidase family protein n=1 Tax=Microbacterium indicum TaxID=358100 RepID=UPI00041CB4D2|nr:pyridoxamine 5'-phosphate oxidase family protein [Microbacterium indicum]